MVKKSVTGLTANKPKKLTNREVQLALIENFVGMQKALTNLTFKFDHLSDNISKLLHLFELSAQTFMRKEQAGFGEDKDVLGKLDTLLDQNKTIAKGLTLIEEKIKHKVYGETKEVESPTHMGGMMGRPMPRPLPRI